MNAIGKIITQDEYSKMMSELLVLQAEEQFEGKDNSKRIKEIKELFEIKE